jgi:uncharacterized protein with NAD-binding domain and iron-sulfur cluster
MEKKHVIIMGAGIGGMAAAHELSKNDNYKITIIERSSILGGQCAESNIDRSIDNEIEDDCDIHNHNNDYTAICWHALSSGYKNFLEILDELVDASGNKLISNLKPLSRFIYAMKDYNHTEMGNAFITKDFRNFGDGFRNLYKRDIPFRDKVRLYKIYVYALSISEEHMQRYDAITWNEYTKDLSTDVRRWLVQSTNIFLGMEYDKLSTYFIFNLLRKHRIFSKLDNKHAFYSFDGSMKKKLFDPWQKHLESKGVKFLLNHSISKIYHVDSLTTIASIDVKHGDITKVYTADIFINAMDIKSIGHLYPSGQLSANKLNYLKLHDLSKQVQMHVLYYIPYRLQDDNISPTILVLPDSKWFLMIKIEGNIWQTKDCDLLCCAIGLWNIPGINGKCAINCTRTEIANECWAQILATQHNLKLSTTTVPEWNIWHNFQFNPVTMHLETHEPKFSNNINTLKLRPHLQDTLLRNLYHATAYAKTETFIYNIEGAAESGVSVAKLIQNIELPKPKLKSKKLIFRITRFVDKIFTKLFESMRI